MQDPDLLAQPHEEKPSPLSGFQIQNKKPSKQQPPSQDQATELKDIQKQNEKLQKKYDELKSKSKLINEKLVKAVTDKVLILTRLEELGFDFALLEKASSIRPNISQEKHRSEKVKKHRVDHHEQPEEVHVHRHYHHPTDCPQMPAYLSASIKLPCPLHSVSPPPAHQPHQTLASASFSATPFSMTGTRFPHLVSADLRPPRYHQTSHDQNYQSPAINDFIKTEDQAVQRPPRPEKLDIADQMKEYPQFIHPSVRTDPVAFVPPMTNHGNMALVSGATYRDNIADLTEDELQNRIKHLLHHKETFYSNK